MDYKTVIKQIKSGQILPLYLCYGTEKYQIQQFVELIKDHLIERDQQDFAIAAYDLAETPIEVVVEEAETIPFLVPRKLIVVRDSSLFTAGKDNNKIEHRIDVFQDYIQKPADHSVIIVVVNNDKLDERKKIVKTMKSAGYVLPFMSLSQNELTPWVIHEVEKRGSIIRESAAEALIATVGVQMAALAAELDKLCLYAGAEEIIDIDTVEQLVTRSIEQNVFVMVEHIANVRLEQALSIFYELLKQKEEPIKIVALIARQFRMMLLVKELSRQSYSQQQIASQLGMPPFAVKKTGEQARRFEVHKLKAILSEIAELDYKMKSGGIDKVLGMELFIMRLGVG